LAKTTLLALATVFGPSAPASAEQITVFAAASLKDVLEEAATLWHTETGHDAVFSFAGSSLLARQIELGAPADIYISAHHVWMEHLETNEITLSGKTRTIAGNDLVLVAHDPAVEPLDLTNAPDLGALLGDGQLAMALVTAVPAGIYGKQALEHYGLWDSVAPRIAQTDNVRAALALVSLGEAPLGITYASDAESDANVHVIARFAAESHDPITYPAAVIANSENIDIAAEFLEFLSTPAVHQIFRQKGFLAEEQ